MTLPRGYITGHEMPDSRDRRIAKLESDLTAAKKIHEDDRLTRQLLDAALVREARLREALSMAQETMEERRRYADGWEWKYGPAWDEEDFIIRAALAGTTQEE